MPPGDANATRRTPPGGMAFSGYLKPVILAFSDKVYVAPHLGQVIVYESGVRTKPQSSHKLRTPGIGTSAPQALHFPVVSVEWKEFRSSLPQRLHLAITIPSSLQALRELWRTFACGATFADGVWPSVPS